jgi:ABC-type branched-subunit amino acid transport system ATPase component
LVKSFHRSTDSKKVNQHPLFFFYIKYLFLYSIDVQIQQGSLVALVGMVGSGKTSILAALLGEMNKIEGRVCVSGNIASTNSMDYE